MRHVSRTHRVALDRLFHRINLDPKIQIKYVDTKNQLADILTKGNFTRDEWNHLLRLFNILSFSMFSYSHFSPEDERVVAKSQPMRCLVPKIVGQSPIALGSSASYSLETLKAQSSNSDLTSAVRPVVRGLNEHTASSSPGWHQDENTNTSWRK